jgi:transglutaminase-like putative cysteine protease
MDSRLAGNLVKVNKMGISGKHIAIGTGVVLGGIAVAAWALKRTPSDPLKGLKVISRVTRNGRTMTIYRGKVEIDGRLRLIENKVVEALKDPYTRTLATQITAPCPREDQACAVRQIFDYVHQNIKYVPDPAPMLHEDGTIEPVDMYNGANYTLKEAKAGDCANQVVALGALLGAIGIPSKSRAGIYQHGGPYQHVYRVAKVGGREVVLDTTLQPPAIGREVPALKIFEFPKI